MGWETIAAVAGGIVLIGNVCTLIYKWIRPAIQLKETVQELERRSVNDYKVLQGVKEAIEHNEKVNRMQLLTMMQMINHDIDGNNIEKLKATREHILAMLAEIEK